MASIFGKKTTQAKPKEPTEEEKAQLAAQKIKAEEQARLVAEEQAKNEAKQKQLDKEKKDKEKKDRERKERERKETEDQQKQLDHEAMKLAIEKAIETKLASFKDEIKNEMTQKQPQNVIPLEINNQMKQLNLEHEKLKTQLEVIDKLKDFVRPQTSGIIFYDRKTILIWLRKKFPQLANLNDNALKTEEAIKSLPFYSTLGYEDQQIILFLATCIRRAGMIESHNLVLAKMNEESFKP